MGDIENVVIECGDEMSDLQKKLIPMLKWFHEFCVEHQLKYYALGGTMLGIARHQGFIPWDDDIDVGMPRKDYNKFIELCKDQRFEDYCLETIDTEKDDFYYGYSKIYDVTTTLVERTKTNIKRGIYLDLFPLDGLGDTREEAEKEFYPIFMKYQFLLSRTCAYSKKRAFYKNVAITMARIIPNCIINNKKLMISIDKMCQKKDYNSCEYVGNILGNWGKKEIVPRSVLGEPTLYQFENILVYGAEKYDEYLSNLYGDWRQLPPIEKRVTHHDYVLLDLNRSYLE